MDVMISDIINADEERRGVILSSIASIDFFGDKEILVNAMKDIGVTFTLCDLYMYMPDDKRKDIIVNVLTTLIEDDNEKLRRYFR